MTAATGVLLLTFGSAVTAADVPDYLLSVRGGTPASEEVVAEFQRRYALIGRSPLVDITGEQCDALQRLLDGEHGPHSFVVGTGMLHSAPRVDDAVAALVARGVQRIIGIILSPQYSEQIMSGYGQTLGESGARHNVAVTIAPAWYDLPRFIDCLGVAVTTALAGFDPGVRDRLPVIFTAHSLPRRVVDRDPAYVESLRETARTIAERAGLPPERWKFAYQSAGHSPEDWLKPDFKELLPGLRDDGWREVLVVPTQFVADHLEVLYDIDIAGAEEAAELGMTFRRIAMPNIAPAFIRVLADVVGRELSAGARTEAHTS